MTTFETVAEMKLAHLRAGQLVRTKGYTTAGDGGGANYLIAVNQAVDGFGDHDLANTNVALLQAIGNVEGATFGVIGGGAIDTTPSTQAAITASVGGELQLESDSYLTTALSSSLTAIRWPSGTYNPTLSEQFPIDINDLSAAPILSYGSPDTKHGKTQVNGNITAHDIYNAIFPNIKSYDGFSAITQVVLGSDIEHAAGMSGYVRTETAAPTNAVALFGCGQATVANAAVWGINTLLQDQATRVAGTLTGMVLVNELDFNVMNPDTEIIGLSVGGNSLAQPTTASGFIVNQLGTGFKWTAGFLVQDGACSGVALNAGMIDTSGNNVSSTKVQFSATDNVGTKVTAPLQLIGFSTPFLQLSSVPLKISFNDLWLDSGQGVSVAGNTVISDRKTGWVAPTGTATRTSFATGTVTLPQLAERLKGLIDDLTGHGMIGA